MTTVPTVCNLIHCPLKNSEYDAMNERVVTVPAGG